MCIFVHLICHATARQCVHEPIAVNLWHSFNIGIHHCRHSFAFSVGLCTYLQQALGHSCLPVGRASLQGGPRRVELTFLRRYARRKEDRTYSYDPRPIEIQHCHPRLLTSCACRAPSLLNTDLQQVKRAIPNFHRLKLELLQHPDVALRRMVLVDELGAYGGVLPAASFAPEPDGFQRLVPATT
jgi:hypothetical protein